MVFRVEMLGQWSGTGMSTVDFSGLEQHGACAVWILVVCQVLSSLILPFLWLLAFWAFWASLALLTVVFPPLIS
jgi:hypothetical protein